MIRHCKNEHGCTSTYATCPNERNYRRYAFEAAIQDEASNKMLLADGFFKCLHTTCIRWFINEKSMLEHCVRQADKHQCLDKGNCEGCYHIQNGGSRTKRVKSFKDQSTDEQSEPMATSMDTISISADSDKAQHHQDHVADNQNTSLGVHVSQPSSPGDHGHKKTKLICGHTGCGKPFLKGCRMLNHCSKEHGCSGTFASCPNIPGNKVKFSASHDDTASIEMMLARGYVKCENLPCERWFVKKVNMVSHMQAKHYCDNPKTCPGCPKCDASPPIAKPEATPSIELPSKPTQPKPEVPKTTTKPIIIPDARQTSSVPKSEESVPKTEKSAPKTEKSVPKTELPQPAKPLKVSPKEVPLAQEKSGMKSCLHDGCSMSFKSFTNVQSHCYYGHRCSGRFCDCPNSRAYRVSKFTATPDDTESIKLFLEAGLVKCLHTSCNLFLSKQMLPGHVARMFTHDCIDHITCPGCSPSLNASSRTARKRTATKSTTTPPDPVLPEEEEEVAPASPILKRKHSLISDEEDHSDDDSDESTDIEEEEDDNILDTNTIKCPHTNCSERGQRNVILLHLTLNHNCRKSNQCDGCRVAKENNGRSPSRP
ncbi:hypothetical protein SAMD00019534_080940 [Acytostelium subglobosum LB1]|uniref:hypothetical protein n=1 Tax=Acytostelium subglobosum LB1 TaxID=1410327 RepID=UPI000644C899|nr:hypothetical protein SAMD00019534_080940 [Acytostelium subglobosum LB1]GAM24919.1 hypothetical protein SAMD00019534_080940 [Acytostelium subglobosum LB1]|eukprot:XP_012752008.1 hypothetical protein SAMD00019534_080940 [Acytostelium subglobosum LB1]